MANKWLVHIKKTMKQMKSKGTYKKGMGLKQVIMAAKKTWHSVKGGGDPTPKEPETGDGFVEAAPAVEGGRRKTRRRRHSRRR